MKRFTLYLCLMFSPLLAGAQGFPFIRNYTAAEYGAHNRNFDITIGEDGTVFVANFEGLLYYDRAQWRIIHIPDINRLTVVYRAEDNTIWVGGYNFFARLGKKDNGELYLERIGRPDLFHGEVMEIFEDDGSLLFFVNDGSLFEVKDEQVLLRNKTDRTFGSSLLSTIIRVDDLASGGEASEMSDTIQTEELGNGMRIFVRSEKGLIVADNQHRNRYSVRKENGLCSDDVAYAGYDGHGQLWGATGHGIFSMEIPSVYSYYLPKDGLNGVVHAIEAFNGTIFVGTSNGLYSVNGNTLAPVEGFSHGCWVLCRCSQGLLIGSTNGVYLLSTNGTATQLTNNHSTALLVDGQDIYSGETDGVYFFRIGQQPQKVCDLEKVTRMLKDAQGTIWMQNVYGRVYRKRSTDVTFSQHTTGDISATIVQTGGQVEVVDALAQTPFPYPAFSKCDETGVTWLTDIEGKHLYQWKDGQPLTTLNHLLSPIGETSVNALYRQGNKVWIGGDDILIVLDIDKEELSNLTAKPRLLFRSVVMGGDSVLWGGYGEMPRALPQLASNERNLRFVYALDYAPLTGQTLYRYKLNNDNWSAWNDNHDAEFLNLPYGSYTLSVQARLANGELSETTTIDFSIAYPFFMRWYTILLYFLLFALMVFAFFRYRLKRLRQEKIKLERIVQERTSEVVKQKDEIEEKSKSLEKALDDLSNAQHELIRQEKMATVGKLTQGLIDRILNPLNYINNFSKLSEGLVKDIEANIEDEKDKMDEENFEDTMDVLDMLRGNLQKVSEHGQNTTRTLKAMEEMLKDRTSGYLDMDLLSILKQDEQMLRNYYAEDITRHHIQVSFNVPEKSLMLHGNPELLSRTLMSILSNSIYAIAKKAQRIQFEGSLSLTLTDTGDQYSLSIRDNGIGIEQTIINKIFDPFFTTKTTGEASGVGLYLSREIIQNHGGDIIVKSVKDEYSEFTILLPKLKNQ